MCVWNYFERLPNSFDACPSRQGMCFSRYPTELYSGKGSWYLQGRVAKALDTVWKTMCGSLWVTTSYVLSICLHGWRRPFCSRVVNHHHQIRAKFRLQLFWVFFYYTWVRIVLHGMPINYCWFISFLSIWTVQLYSGVLYQNVFSLPVIEDTRLRLFWRILLGVSAWLMFFVYSDVDQLSPLHCIDASLVTQASSLCACFNESRRLQFLARVVRDVA